MKVLQIFFIDNARNLFRKGFLALNRTENINYLTNL